MPYRAFMLAALAAVVAVCVIPARSAELNIVAGFQAALDEVSPLVSARTFSAEDLALIGGAFDVFGSDSAAGR